MMTPEEAASFEMLQDAFPGSVVGEFEPLAVVEEPDPDVLVPWDLATLYTEEPPEPDYLFPPYVVRGARTWVFGETGAAKSIFHQWVAGQLTREGRQVSYFSGENPATVDRGRLMRLRPDVANLRYFHMPPIDLANPPDFLRVAEACGGSDLIVFDTFSALWSGDENSNREIIAFDNKVLVPLVRLTGAGIAVLHTMGHPQAFVSRGVAGAGRGASAMRDKADIILVFKSGDRQHEFVVHHGKNRPGGGVLEPPTRFRIVDTDDDGLDIERVGKHVDERVAECMDAAVRLITDQPDGIGSKQLREALRSARFGTTTIAEAFAEMKGEQPPRVEQVEGTVVGSNGIRTSGRPWVARGTGGTEGYSRGTE